MISVSTPGKLILMGEHAVVYEHPCIVTAVSERMFVNLEKTQDGKITIDAPQVKDTRFVDQAIIDGCSIWNISHKGMHIKTRSCFSNCYGFGSSSAVTVATLYALVQAFHIQVTKKELFNVAYKTVLTIQGVGSGFDVAAAIYGKTIYYQKGATVVNELDWDLNDDGVSLVVGYSGVKADTPTIVKEIAKKREEQKDKVDKIFTAIAKLVDQAQQAGNVKDWETVGKLMNFNQDYLRNLGVSTEVLEAMIFESKKAGAYGAKLSGAGRGDCMIALAPKFKRKSVEDAIIKAGGAVVPVRVHETGVTIDTKVKE